MRFCFFLFTVEKAGEGRDLSDVLRLSKAAELQWYLTLNEAENEVERREFYYEQVCNKSINSKDKKKWFLLALAG